MMKLGALLSKRFTVMLLPMLLCALLGAVINSSPAASATAPGVIATVAGNGTEGYTGDGGPAASAEISGPEGVAVDAAGNLYIADTQNDRVRKVDTSGIITTVAGNGSYSFSGDGGPATSTSLNYPTSVAVDASGNLYIADTQNDRVRKVDTSGIITTVAGNGMYASMYTGEGGSATKATIYPEGLAVDASGNLYIADTPDSRICKVDKNGTITTVAGNGTLGYSGDGGPATSASLNSPLGVAVDASGNLYIADTGNNLIRKVDTSGIITTLAGNGNWPKGYAGSHVPATDALLNYPTGVAVDASGNLYIADLHNYRVRKVDTSGIITTVAGNGIPSYSGDGGQATNAELCFPYGVAVDASGDLYITDTYAIRDVTAPIASSPATGSEQTAIIFTAGQPSYTVGGQSFAMDVSPFVSNGRVLVPVRYLADALGAQTSWDASGMGAVQRVDITCLNITAVLNIDSASMELSIRSNAAPDIKTIQMDVAPVIINGRTYLPARYVAEAFGCNVSWDAAARTVTVSPPST